MVSLPVLDRTGAEVDTYEIDPAALAPRINKQLLHDAVVMYQANSRQGSAKTKGRSEVSGASQKMYRQKHTGRARAGSIRSPLRRGGGVTFGPKPRSYRKAMPKKMRRLALKCVISAKAKDKEMMVLDELKLDEPKTKEILKLLAALGVESSAIIATGEPMENVVKSARNIPGVATVPAQLLNIVVKVLDKSQEEKPA